jgi:mRNA interferase MazF
VVIKRGEIWWASLPEPAGSGPGLRRPVVVISSNEFNKSLIKTCIVAVISSNLRLGEAPGNIYLSKKHSGLSKESVINVSQIITVDKLLLTEKIKTLTNNALLDLDIGLKLSLNL